MSTAPNQQEPGSRNYTLVDLLPEPITFTFKDGDVVRQLEMRTPEMFGAEDSAVMLRANKVIMQGQQAYAKAHTDEQKLDVLAGMEQHLDRCLAVILPELPASKLKRIKVAEKLNIVGWWGQQTQAAKSGEVPAGQPNRATRRKRTRNRRRQK